MMKHVAVFTLLLVLTVGVVYAQVMDCPDLVLQAIAVMDDMCQDITRNQACYGNGRIDVEPQPNVRIEAFDTPGDKLDVAVIERLTLSELDTDLGEWGVILLSIQANLPDTLPGQNVSILLFGDSEIVNAGDAMEAFYFTGGIGQPRCNDAPDGILIQSPEGDDVIELVINNVDVTFGSTAYIIAEPEGEMTFALLEGSASLTALGETVSLAGGEFTTIQLDEELIPISVPSAPQAITNILILPDLPLMMLPLQFQTDTDTAERINPISGNWLYTPETVEGSAGCPPMMLTMMQTSMGMSETDFLDFGGDNFNFETWLMASSDGEMAGGEFSEPEPNTYQYTVVIEDTIVIFELSIITPTAIVGYSFFDLSDSGMDCQITVSYSAEVIP